MKNCVIERAYATSLLMTENTLLSIWNEITVQCTNDTMYNEETIGVNCGETVRWSGTTSDRRCTCCVAISVFPTQSISYRSLCSVEIAKLSRLVSFFCKYCLYSSSLTTPDETN